MNVISICSDSSGGELLLDSLPNPPLDAVDLLCLVSYLADFARATLLDVEVRDGFEHVPLPPLALLLKGGTIPADVIDDTEPAARGDEIASGDGGGPRLGDEAHGGQGDVRGGEHARADEALEVCLGGAGLGGQVDVDVGDEGGGDEGDEDGRHEPAQEHLRGVAQGLVGADVGWGDDADEEGADQE